MTNYRSAFATHPMDFGRRCVHHGKAPPAVPQRLSEDLRLFATTFVAGFLFVSVFIA